MASQRTIGNIVGPWRFLAFLAALLVVVPLAMARLHNWALATMAGFDVAALICLLLSAPLLRSRDPKLVREHARQNDANRTLLLIITGIVLIALLAAIGAETMDRRPEPLTKLLVIATLILAWLFSNVVCALHYTHLAYLDQDRADDEGLDFPGTDQPVHADFVYFAFTLGMTFQTSDVVIRDPRIRRFVTLHSFGAFVFNIGVLAFTINVLGSG
jgi:uncharacterized membrane protein